MEEGHESDQPHHTLNIIVRGFARGKQSSSSRKKFSRHVMHIDRAPPLDRAIVAPEINFSNKDIDPWELISRFMFVMTKEFWWTPTVQLACSTRKVGCFQRFENELRSFSAF